MAPRWPLTLIYSDRAHDHIESARAYIAERNPEAAARVVGAIEAACERLERDSGDLNRVGIPSGLRV